MSDRIDIAIKSRLGRTSLIGGVLLALSALLAPAEPPAKLNPKESPPFFGSDFEPGVKRRAELRKKYPDVHQWIEHRYHGVDFLFCLDQQPGWGCPPINFHGWYYYEKWKCWMLLVTLRMTAVCGAEIFFDDGKGTCSVRGSANDDLKGMNLLTVSLRTIGGVSGNLNKNLPVISTKGRHE